MLVARPDFLCPQAIRASRPGYGSQLMEREDPDVADELRRILSDEGTEVLLAAETLRVQGESK